MKPNQLHVEFLHSLLSLLEESLVVLLCDVVGQTNSGVRGGLHYLVSVHDAALLGSTPVLLDD